MAADRYSELRQQHCSDFESVLPQIVERTRWPSEQLREDRQTRLRTLLRVARQGSPWHASRLTDVDADSFNIDDIAELPSMSKQDLMSNYDDIAPDPRITLTTVNQHIQSLTGGAYLFDRYSAIASGGSSGLRGVFVYDWDGWMQIAGIGQRWTIRELTANPLPPIDNPVSATVFADKASHVSYAIGATFSREGPGNARFPINMAVKDIVEGLNRVQPDSLGAYASALQILADEARAGRLNIRPRRIWTCGEPLYPEIIAAVAREFGVTVSDLWGMSEGGYAGSCGEGAGMHLSDDLTWIEPVDADGKPVPAGTRAAKFLFTNLYNHALPLIRYEVSDEIMVLEEQCPCGSGHRRISSVLGRQDDLFRYDSVTIHPQIFRSPLGREANVMEYRVTQTMSGAHIALCTRGAIDQTGLGGVIRKGLVEAGLAEPMLEFELVESLDRQDTGKLKRFVPLARG